MMIKQKITVAFATFLLTPMTYAACVATAGSVSSSPAGGLIAYTGSPAADSVDCDNAGNTTAPKATVDLGEGADTLVVKNAPETTNPSDPAAGSAPAFGAVDGDFYFFVSDATASDDRITIELASTVEQIYGDRFMGVGFPIGGNTGGADEITVTGASTVGFISGDSFWTNLAEGGTGGDDRITVDNATLHDDSRQYAPIMGDEFLVGTENRTQHIAGNDTIIITNNSRINGDIFGEIYKYDNNPNFGTPGSENVKVIAGNDNITVDNSVLTGSIYGEAYGDSVFVIGHQNIDDALIYNNYIYEKNGVTVGNDTVNLLGENTQIGGGVYLYNGNDTVNYTAGSVTEVIDGGDDKDNTLDDYTDRFNLVGVTGKTIADFGGVTEAQLLNFEAFALTQGSQIDYEANYDSPNYLLYIVDETSTATMTNNGAGTYQIHAKSTVNEGEINLTDGQAGDALTVSGDYSGAGQLLVDVNTQTQQADKLLVGGNTTGSTTEIVPNFVIPTVTQPYEIPIVEVTGVTAAGDFTFPGGVTSLTENGVRYDLILDGKIWKIRVIIPELSVVKTAVLSNDVDGDGVIDVGDTLTYTVTATNSGNVSLSDVVVNDAKLDASETCAVVAPTQTCELRADYVVTQADMDAGNIENEATANAAEIQTPKTATHTQPLSAAPQLSLVKTAVLLNDIDGDGKVDVGDTLAYTVTATNSGNVSLTDVVVNDAKLSASETCAVVVPTQTCELRADYIVTQADMDAGNIENEATANATEIQTPEMATHTQPLIAAPQLSVVKTAVLSSDVDGDGVIDVGDTLAYTVTATNSGNVSLTDVVVNDAKLSASETCATVAPTQTCELRADYVVTQADMDAGNIENEATANATEIQTPETATHTQPLIAAPQLSLVKTAELSNDVDGDGVIDVGDTLAYTVTATNSGNVSLSDVVVNDAKLSASETCATVALAQICELRADYIVTQADMDAGNIENEATATATEIATAVKTALVTAIDTKKPERPAVKAVPTLNAGALLILMMALVGVSRRLVI